MIAKIGENIGENFVRRLLKQKRRKSSSIGYGNAQSVGMVYRIKDKDYQHFITSFVKYLATEIGFKDIQTLGFHNGSEVPDFLSEEKRFLAICKKDLKWNKVPKDEKIEEFTSRKYDILIDLTDGFSIPLKYAFAVSDAKFKIGVHEEENVNFYDFMITLPKNATLQQYINQVNHYLNLIR